MLKYFFYITTVSVLSCLFILCDARAVYEDELSMIIDNSSFPKLKSEPQPAEKEYDIKQKFEEPKEGEFKPQPEEGKSRFMQKTGDALRYLGDWIRKYGEGDLSAKKLDAFSAATLRVLTCQLMKKLILKVSKEIMSSSWGFIPYFG